MFTHRTPRRISPRPVTVPYKRNGLDLRGNKILCTDTSGNPNVVVYITIEDTKTAEGTPIKRTLYGLNWHGIELRKAVIENPNATTFNAVCTSKILNANGSVQERITYDAWNRLVQVKDSDNTTVVASYQYNGMNHRVKKTVGTTVTTHYFNEGWQELVSYTGPATNPDTQYVWGIRYIDDLLYRERDTNNDGTLDERLYSLADPNWNVVALTDTNGTVQERYNYNAFGKHSIYENNGTARTTSSYAWNRTFTGQVYDNDTGIMLYRNRCYHASLGRFISRDPIGYRGRDMSLLRYISNKSIIVMDPLGLQMPGQKQAICSREKIQKKCEENEDDNMCMVTCVCPLGTFSPNGAQLTFHRDCDAPDPTIFCIPYAPPYVKNPKKIPKTNTFPKNPPAYDMPPKTIPVWLKNIRFPMIPIFFAPILDLLDPKEFRWSPFFDRKKGGGNKVDCSLLFLAGTQGFNLYPHGGTD